MIIINKIFAVVLSDDIDDPQSIVKYISNGVPLSGFNLLNLVFAVIIASIGLNVNSTAVIIGAMLISPLMGPIMGLGLGLGINDFPLIKTSLKNFGYSVIAALAASMIYFSVSPIDDAGSEILSRTTPAIWDVLIAFFGGLAGIFAVSSKGKGNVLPGVAIATALMPPLCTAGFGLAHGNISIFWGAVYLFIINSIFISLATLIAVRILKFPIIHFNDPKREKNVKRLIFILVLATILPSIYAAYNIVRQNDFVNKATKFISTETNISGNYLLNKDINPSKRSILLTFGGKGLTDKQKKQLTDNLGSYGIDEAVLNFKEGFDLSKTTLQGDEKSKFIAVISSLEQRVDSLHTHLDSSKNASESIKQMFLEARAQHSELKEIAISKITTNHNDTNASDKYLAYFQFAKRPSREEVARLKRWIQIKEPSKKIITKIDY